MATIKQPRKTFLINIRWNPAAQRCTSNRCMYFDDAGVLIRRLPTDAEDWSTSTVPPRGVVRTACNNPQCPLPDFVHGDCVLSSCRFPDSFNAELGLLWPCPCMPSAARLVAFDDIQNFLMTLDGPDDVGFGFLMQSRLQKPKQPDELLKCLLAATDLRLGNGSEPTDGFRGSTEQEQQPPPPPPPQQQQQQQQQRQQNKQQPLRPLPIYASNANKVGNDLAAATTSLSSAEEPFGSSIQESKPKRQRRMPPAEQQQQQQQQQQQKQQPIGRGRGVEPPPPPPSFWPNNPYQPFPYQKAPDFPPVDPRMMNMMMSLYESQFQAPRLPLYGAEQSALFDGRTPAGFPPMPYRFPSSFAPDEMGRMRSQQLQQPGPGFGPRMLPGYQSWMAGGDAPVRFQQPGMHPQDQLMQSQGGGCNCSDCLRSGIQQQQQQQQAIQTQLSIDLTVTPNYVAMPAYQSGSLQQQQQMMMQQQQRQFVGPQVSMFSSDNAVGDGRATDSTSPTDRVDTNPSPDTNFMHHSDSSNSS